eukprot:COSAG01_NODE_11994_length_1820_cov_1.569436_1_plen_89_part_00
MQNRKSIGTTGGAFRMAARIVREEGPSAGFRGLSASWVRQCTYGTLRVGLYDVFKVWVAQPGGSSQVSNADRPCTTLLSTRSALPVSA